MRFVGVCACVLGLSATAAADDVRLEASGFVGLDYFGDNIELGNSWAPEQIPGTSPVLGARIGYLALPALWDGGDYRLQLAFEGEIALATAFTGGNFDGGRMSYFAPVFGWRTHGKLRLAGLPHVQPHLVLGVGGETVTSTSPFMAKETDPVFYYGPGAAYRISAAWEVRIDLRHGVMPARHGTGTSTFELQLGISTTFGLPAQRSHATTVVAPVLPKPPPPPVEDDKDGDQDGIPDRLDNCPAEPETVNGITDDDGCAEPDPDGDALVGESDRCPDQAEDFDRFQDGDGCPELDNDNDSVIDARDACPMEPETKNGFDDADGCPDSIPPEVLATLDIGKTLKFEPKKSKLTKPAQQALDAVAALMREKSVAKLDVIGHPETQGDAKAAIDLAKRRAEAVKWYLVDQGIAADQVVPVVGTSQAPKGPVVELRIAK